MADPIGSGTRRADWGSSAKMLHDAAVQIFNSGLDGPDPPRYMIAQMTVTKPTFPAPDHDHNRCTADAMDHAERVCERRGRKFPPIPREVVPALVCRHPPPRALWV